MLQTILPFQFPSDWNNPMSGWIMSAAFASGEGLAFQSSSTLSQTWPTVQVTPGEICSGSSFSATITPTGSDGSVGIYVDLDNIDDPRYYAWVASAGSSCSSEYGNVDPRCLFYE